MGVSKIQIGQLWKKDGTGDTYLVTSVYTEALSTMVVLRKSRLSVSPVTKDELDAVVSAAKTKVAQA